AVVDPPLGGQDQVAQVVGGIDGQVQAGLVRLGGRLQVLRGVGVRFIEGRLGRAVVVVGRVVLAAEQVVQGCPAGPAAPPPPPAWRWLRPGPACDGASPRPAPPPGLRPAPPGPSSVLRSNPRSCSPDHRFPSPTGRRSSGCPARPASRPVRCPPPRSW